MRLVLPTFTIFYLFAAQYVDVVGVDDNFTKMYKIHDLGSTPGSRPDMHLIDNPFTLQKQAIQCCITFHVADITLYRPQ